MATVSSLASPHPRQPEYRPSGRQQPSQDHHQQDQPPRSLSPKSDSASSLRQAALLTLRSKRRKINNGSSVQVPLATRSVLTGSPPLLLDYGQEEPSSADIPPSIASLTISTSTPTTPGALAPTISETESAKSPHQDDVVMREEGEISDNEEPSTSTQHQTAKPSSIMETSDMRFSDRSPDIIPSPPTPNSALVSHGLSVLSPDSDLVDSASSQVFSSSHVLDNQISKTPVPEAGPYIVDANHVRPGLSS